jgi:hypothetical protein
MYLGYCLVDFQRLLGKIVLPAPLRARPGNPTETVSC